jgi:hypothetical protein
MHCSSEVIEGKTHAAGYGTAILKRGDELPARAIVHKVEVLVADGFRRADFAGGINDNIDHLFRLRQGYLTDYKAAKRIAWGLTSARGFGEAWRPLLSPAVS